MRDRIIWREWSSETHKARTEAKPHRQRRPHSLPASGSGSGTGSCVFVRVLILLSKSRRTHAQSWCSCCSAKSSGRSPSCSGAVSRGRPTPSSLPSRSQSLWVRPPRGYRRCAPHLIAQLGVSSLAQQQLQAAATAPGGGHMQWRQCLGRSGAGTGEGSAEKGTRSSPPGLRALALGFPSPPAALRPPSEPRS